MILNRAECIFLLCAQIMNSLDNGGHCQLSDRLPSQKSLLCNFPVLYVTYTNVGKIESRNVVRIIARRDVPSLLIEQSHLSLFVTLYVTGNS